MRKIRLNESDLQRIIKRTINESGLLLEKIACKDDGGCNASSVCDGGCGCGFPLTNSSCPCCAPICSKRHRDCGPLSVADDSPKKEIAERGREMVTPVGGKWYCVMEGRDCWELDERDRSAKGNKGYRSERRCNKNC